MKQRGTNHTHPKYIAYLFLLALLAGAITYYFPNLFWPVEQQVFRFQMNSSKQVKPDEKIILVLGSDFSMTSLGTWPLPRQIYAQAIDNLAQAKTIGLDLAFFQKSNLENDQELSAAIKNHGNVVMVNFLDTNKKTSIQPEETFAPYASEIGYVDFFYDSDNTLRKYNFVLEDTIDSTYSIYPSFVYSILKAHGYSLTLDDFTNTVHIQKDNGEAPIAMQLDKDYRYWIQDNPIEDFEIYELDDVYNGKIPSENFQDAIVILSISAHGIASPIEMINGYTTEPIMMANAIRSLLTGFNPLEIPPLYNAVLSATLFFLCGIITLFFPLSKNLSFITPVLLSLFVFIASHLLFKGNVLYIHSFTYIFWIVFSYLVAIIIKFMIVSRSIGVIKLPIAQIFQLEVLHNGSLQDYLADLGKIIEKDTGIRVLEPIINLDNPVFEQVQKTTLDDIAGNGILVLPQSKNNKGMGYTAVSHLNLDGETARNFTLLGVKNFVSPQVLNSVAALIMTSSLYFKALQKNIEREDLFYRLILCMAEAIDAKDPITAGHSNRVADLSLEIGKKMGLDKKDLDELRLAGIIHDIGKIGINDSVLNKPGTFTSQEFALMKEHPQKGNAIMKPANLSEQVVDGILNHHERPDGKGYPRGLTEKDLGKFASIIKIADVYDALVSERQYKKPWPVDKACDIIYQGRGTEFDTQAADVFLAHFAPAGWQPHSPVETPSLVNTTLIGQHISYAAELSLKASTFLQEFKGNLSKCPAGMNLESRNDFYGLEWGEFYGTENFLAQNPSLIGRIENSGICFFAFSSAPPASHVLYLFFKKYLAGGIIFFPDTNKDFFTGCLGNASFETPDTLYWDKGKFFVVMRTGSQPGNNSVQLIYLTKYAFEEKDNTELP